MAMTMGEKILANAAGLRKVCTDDVVCAKVNMAMTHEVGALLAFEVLEKAGFKKVWNPEKIVVIIGNNVPAPTVQDAINQKK
jgi:3-isopropylmalate/(R)-2-methylmalate dehydratase large subunit